MKKAFWGFVVFVLYPFNKLKSFEIFCKKIDGTSDDEWTDYLYTIYSEPILKDFFKIN